MPESSHKDVNLGVAIKPFSNTYATDMSPSMALDSGIHARMTVFSRSVGLVYDDGRWSITAIKLSRHTGMDCRYPEHREVNLVCPPWHLGSGNPCRNDVVFLNLMAVALEHGNQNKPE